MSHCETFYKSGFGDCKKLRDSVEGFLILDNDATLTKADAKTLTGLKGVCVPIAGDKGFILDCRNGVEVSGGENEITASNLQFNVLTDRSAIQATAYLNGSFKDYQSLLALEGRSVKIALIDKKGNLTGTNDDATNLTPFTGKMFFRYGLPMVGADRQKDYVIDIYFEDLEEWGANEETIVTDYRLSNIFNDVNPVGLDLSIISDYAAGGNFTVQLNYRNESRPFADATAVSNWTVLSAASDVGATLTVASAANAALGQYTLNVVDGTASDMSGSFVIQAKDDDTTYITYKSGTLVVNK